MTLLLKTEVKNSILHIVLNDPASRNAFSPDMAQAFQQAYLRSSNYKAVVLSALGPSFCSGGNLRFYKDLASKDEGLQHNSTIREILQEFSNLPVPKACFVNGTVYGGGIELLSCFDFIAASPQSLFGLWQRRVGLSFGWGGQERLQKRLGETTLMEWLQSAETRSVYSALEMGLVDKVLFSSQGLGVCENWIEKVLSFGEESLVALSENPDQPEKVFEKLWLSEKHKSVLDKFK